MFQETTAAAKQARRRATEAQGWKLIWSDDFDYNGLPDPKKWDYEVGLIRNDEKQYYTRARRENARVENGNLILEARREPFEKASFTAASINTLGKFTFQYGRIEVCALLPDTLGTWPAVWMMGEDIGRVGWPRCGEIDIMEHVAHNPGVVHATVHQVEANGTGHWSKGGTRPVPDFAKAFHTYAVEWSKEKLDFFIDDAKFFTFPYEGPARWTFDRRMYLLLNLAIGGSWGGQKGIDESKFPQQYRIAFARVYQRR